MARFRIPIPDRLRLRFPKASPPRLSPQPRASGLPSVRVHENIPTPSGRGPVPGPAPSRASTPAQVAQPSPSRVRTPSVYQESPHRIGAQEPTTVPTRRNDPYATRRTTSSGGGGGGDPGDVPPARGKSYGSTPTERSSFARRHPTLTTAGAAGGIGLLAGYAYAGGRGGSFPLGPDGKNEGGGNTPWAPTDTSGDDSYNYFEAERPGDFFSELGQGLGDLFGGFGSGLGRGAEAVGEGAGAAIRQAGWLVIAAGAAVVGVKAYKEYRKKNPRRAKGKTQGKASGA